MSHAQRFPSPDGVHAAHDVPGPNLAPLIDVGLILVAFLLVCVTWTSFDRRIENRLPTGHR